MGGCQAENHRPNGDHWCDPDVDFTTGRLRTSSEDLSGRVEVNGEGGPNLIVNLILCPFCIWTRRQLEGVGVREEEPCKIPRNTSSQLVSL